MTTFTYTCPACGKHEGLWEGVEIPGWRAIGADGKPCSTPYGNTREADWCNAQPDGDVGCGECSWEGHRRDLLVDGKPLPAIHPAQQRLQESS
jgi:hypothetical protein